jgi:hypothetical protein
MGIFRKKIGIEKDDILTIIKDILREAVAGDKVYLISPYWKLNVNVRESIIEALKKGVQIRCLIREGEVLKDEDQIFVDEYRLDLKTLDHLHAKVYWSPTIAMVTSMNLHNYSDKETREIAVVFGERALLDETEKVSDEWWDRSSRYQMRRQTQGAITSPTTTSERRMNVDKRGFCISCGKPKAYSPKYPLCEECWQIYAKHKDKKHTEKVCHGCGQQIQSSQARPLCGKCYQLDPFDKKSA